MGFGSIFLRNRQQQAASPPLFITASATVTENNLADYDVISAGHASTPVVLALVPASLANRGMIRYVVNNNAQTLTVVCAAGFGGTNLNTAPITQGLMAILVSDGVNWYVTVNGTLTTS